MNNSIFDIKRFGQIIIRDFVSNRGILIGTACGLLGIFIYFISQYRSYNSGMGTEVLIASYLMIIISPILGTIKRKDPVINTLLPASTFEKYLSLLITYVLIVPFVISITLFILNICAGLLVGTSDTFKETLSLRNLFDPHYYLMAIMFQSVFILSSLSFKRYAGLKALLIIVIIFLLYYWIVFSLATKSISNDLLMEYHYKIGSVEKILMLSKYSGEKISSLVMTMIVIIKVIFPFGIWYTGYLKMKEREV